MRLLGKTAAQESAEVYGQTSNRSTMTARLRGYAGQPRRAIAAEGYPAIKIAPFDRRKHPDADRRVTHEGQGCIANGMRPAPFARAKRSGSMFDCCCFRLPLGGFLTEAAEQHVDSRTKKNWRP